MAVYDHHFLCKVLLVIENLAEHKCQTYCTFSLLYCYLSTNINNNTMRLYEFEESTKGSYAAVTFDPATVKALEAYQYDNQIPNPLSPDEFHTTVMFSRNYIPTFETLGNQMEWPGMFTKWGIFPSYDKSALVLKYECHQLTDLFEQIMKKYDATWDHPSFIPHITLSYNVDDLDISQLPKYDGPIIIINEYSDDLDLSTNWADDHK